MVKKQSDIPLGVWAYYANGTVKSYDDADTGAIGVALVTANVSILIDKQESGALAFGGMNKDLTGAATFTSSPFTDFNGESNTTGIIAACAGYTASGITGAPAAEYCRTRLNGKGYLPSKGEMYEIGSNVTAVRNMMIKIGGGQYPNENIYYWTSTLGGNISRQAWRHSGYYTKNKDYEMDRTNTYYARAICKL